ncbi:hypothetical protein RB594_008899 [Gaeumannomyces avenae]
MSQPSQSQAPPAHPTLINLPQPPSNPDTPSEVPGTPTSTTTSLSALSTTAIKDGHRGHAQHMGNHRGHQHHSSTTSLEAERADRISRLTGMSNLLSAQRGPGGSGAQNQSAGGFAQQNNQTTPTSGQFPPGTIPAQAPAYFDSNGQPVASTKISTVGTASATSSGDGRTTTLGDTDHPMDDVDADDVGSVDTNFIRGAIMGDDSASVGGRSSHQIHQQRLHQQRRGGEGLDQMDEELLERGSAGGGGGMFDDRMSDNDDDGSASLVGFGEGAGSTVSGPIYQRRPVPGTSSAGAMAFARWQLERSASGLSDSSVGGGQLRRDMVRGVAAPDAILGGGGDVPAAAAASQERRDARMVDGVAMDGAGRAGVAAPEDDDVFVDTTTRSPVPVASPKEQTGQPRRHYPQQTASPTAREAVERIVQRLDESEPSAGGGGGPALGSSKSPDKKGDRVGQFSFEKK